MIRQRVNQHARVGSDHDLHALSGIDEQFRDLSNDVGMKAQLRILNGDQGRRRGMQQNS